MGMNWFRRAKCIIGKDVTLVVKDADCSNCSGKCKFDLAKEPETKEECEKLKTMYKRRIALIDGILLRLEGNTSATGADENEKRDTQWG